ncbi:fibronectin type III domain-containing protein [candidate division KSB1 bacterium]|nr:fibronectin type III domain-containing protein [candidate division KSB1 bacterium]
MLRKTLTFLLFIFPLFFTLSFSQTININELHVNNASGIPVLLDQVVTIAGEVTVSNQFGSAANVQDYTGGVVVYDAAFASSVNVGDYVKISGKVTQYNGLTELDEVTILEHTPQIPTIEPQLVTCQDVRAEGSGSVENLEGRLIRINNITVNTDNWNVSGSGANFTLTDGTGSCEIRIDKDTEIANTVAPGASKFDVIGVLSQYDRDAPYTEGYQLMPRFNSDIIWQTGPRFTSKPEEKNITPNSMTISWGTDSESNSILMYGETNNYEINTLQIDEAVTHHEVALNGLKPATVYYVKVGSGDDSGTNYYSNHIVITSSDPASTGEMNVYLNRSVDLSFALPNNEAKGGQNLAQKFIDRVNSSKFSIDVCFYSWNLYSVSTALINAHNRGVKIRYVHDEDHYNQSQVQRLKNAGITVIDQRFSDKISYGIQHNKFVVFDARDQTSIYDDWIWTGSLNMTDYTGLGINAAQNVIEIQDQSLAKVYIMEFNEMWGSENETPNASKSLFGYNKTDNTPHKFIINNSLVELYFCPTDRATSKIINAIKSANKEIYFCVLAFTRTDVSQAMQNRFSSLDGLFVRGVFNKDQDSYSQWYPLHGEGDYAWNPPADVWQDKESGVLHHKYMIIDANHANSDPIVITGSQNWSTSAETKNDENTLIIHDPLIANQYLQEFAARYKAAGGTNNLTKVELGSPAIPNSYSLQQNYPNPFNSSTTIKFYNPVTSNTSLIIYNISGQEVRTFDLGYCTARQYKINWDGTNNAEKLVAAGVYFYRLNVSGLSKNTQIKKMIYLP